LLENFHPVHLHPLIPVIGPRNDCPGPRYRCRTLRKPKRTWL
jgi:hypothetical protein